MGCFLTLYKNVAIPLENLKSFWTKIISEYKLGFNIIRTTHKEIIVHIEIILLRID